MRGRPRSDVRDSAEEKVLVLPAPWPNAGTPNDDTGRIECPDLGRGTSPHRQ